MEPLKKLGIETLVLDVSDSDGITTVRDIIARQTGGKLDILVNNA